MRYVMDRTDGWTDVQTKLQIIHGSVGLAHGSVGHLFCNLKVAINNINKMNGGIAV